MTCCSSASWLLPRRSAPALHLPSLVKPVVAVRFCPLLFKRTAGSATPRGAQPPFDLPYRCVFAAATQDSVLIYDTEVSRPLVSQKAVH